jgi:hypothetical protein
MQLLAAINQRREEKLTSNYRKELPSNGQQANENYMTRDSLSKIQVRKHVRECGAAEAPTV